MTDKRIYEALLSMNPFCALRKRFSGGTGGNAPGEGGVLNRRKDVMKNQKNSCLFRQIIYNRQMDSMP